METVALLPDVAAGFRVQFGEKLHLHGFKLGAMMVRAIGAVKVPVVSPRCSLAFVPRP